MSINGKIESESPTVSQSTLGFAEEFQNKEDYLTERYEIATTPFAVARNGKQWAIMFKQYVIVYVSNKEEAYKWYEENWVTAIITAAAITMEMVKKNKHD